MRLSLVIIIFLPLASSAFLKSKLPVRPFSQQECMMCQFTASMMNYALMTQRGAEQVYKLTDSFCRFAQIESPMVCSNITKLFNREVVKVLTNAIVNPSQLCGLLSNNTCGTYHNPMEDWEVNLNISASLNHEEIAKIRLIEQERKKPAQPYQVIQISDTHVDLKYKNGSIANCGEPLCCRSTSSRSNSTILRAGYWGSYGSCDVPLRTLESALKAINGTLNDNNVAYIIWTGDIQPHDVWDQSKEQAIATYDAVFQKIYEYLPNITIFPTLGNHENVPVDSFSPSNLLSIARDDSPEWLYKKMNSYWSRWLPKDAIKTITKDGFYSVTVRPGLKIISLNTNFCHNKNFWLYIDSTDPGNQLEWLIHELQISELEHEMVQIIGHIPPGTDDCLKVWSKNYNKIVRRFSKTIAGQYFGHTHSNEFEIFYTQEPIDQGASENHDTWTPISVGHIGPSVTTFIGMNPSFRVYTIDPNQDFAAINFETRFMNLTMENLKAISAQPEWISTGGFAQEFGIADTSPMSLHKLLVQMVEELREEEAADIQSWNSIHDTIQPFDRVVSKRSAVSDRESKLFKFYRLYHGNSDAFSRADFDLIHRSEKRRFLCSFFTSESHTLSACERFIPELTAINEVVYE